MKTQKFCQNLTFSIWRILIHGNCHFVLNRQVKVLSVRIEQLFGPCRKGTCPLEVTNTYKTRSDPYSANAILSKECQLKT